MFNEIRQTFSSFKTAEEKYHYLMNLSKRLPPYPEMLKTSSHLIPGCQSQLWLSTTLTNGKLFFNAHSDALISKGLAALLIWAYNGHTPEELLRNPPTFLQELGIFASLSPSRSSGLAQVYLQMQKEAVKYLVKL